ncbi:hypothetical protein N9Y07_05525 [Alphaproteobacteria bacterium]|nr:hypothetical protein [Alphaproteobacteria bacterium]
MDNANLFQLGIGLATGTQVEDFDSGSDAARHNDSDQAYHGLRLVSDEARDDHFIRRDGKIFAGTHLIIEVVNGTGLDNEDLMLRLALLNFPRPWIIKTAHFS